MTQGLFFSRTHQAGLFMSVTRGALWGQGSKPVAVLQAVAWLWDINSTLSAVMKTSSTDIDHTKCCCPMHFSSPLCSAERCLGCYESIRCECGAVPTRPSITAILLFVVLLCHSCLFWFELHLQTITVLFICCVVSHCLYLPLLALLSSPSVLCLQPQLSSLLSCQGLFT